MFTLDLVECPHHALLKYVCFSEALSLTRLTENQIISKMCHIVERKFHTTWKVSTCDKISQRRQLKVNPSATLCQFQQSIVEVRPSLSPHRMSEIKVYLDFQHPSSITATKKKKTSKKFIPSVLLLSVTFRLIPARIVEIALDVSNSERR